MKRLHLMLALALAAGTVWAAAPPTALPAWDQLSAAQHEVLIAPIRDRWDANPPARAHLFEHARRWQQLTPQQRARAHHGLGKWERMDPQQRQTMRALFHAMREMTPGQRRVLRERWRTMTAQQRRAWIAANPPAGD